MMHRPLGLLGRMLTHEGPERSLPHWMGLAPVPMLRLVH
jgi:hypothetical protein